MATLLTHNTPVRPGSARRLGVLILFSVTLHVVLISLWQKPAAVALQTGPVVQLTINQPQQADAQAAPQAAPPEPEPAPAPQTEATATTATPAPQPTATTVEQQTVAETSTSQAVPTQPVHNSHSSQATETDLTAEPKSPGISLETAKREILARVRDDIARHFKYPTMARRMGWEGEVRLGVHILANGNIEQIVIAQSSGYSLLDRSAVETLNRIGQVNGASGWLQGRSLELQLPVIYRLTSS